MLQSTYDMIIWICEHSMFVIGVVTVIAFMKVRIDMKRKKELKELIKEIKRELV